MSRAYREYLEFTQLKKDIEENWLRLESTPGVFRYKIDIRKSKVLDGSYKFVVQIERRIDETKFNFNKVKPDEILCTFRDVTFLINNSPLTKFHTLLCPSMKQNLPQILTAEAIRFGIDLLVDFREPSYRIGYNSLGALASVNHLHLHLLRIEQALWINQESPSHLISKVFTNNVPVKYYYVNCHFFKIVHETVDSIFKIVNYFHEQNIPYNIMFTYHERGCCEVVTAFIFPRMEMGSVKDYSQLNIACCEFGGFINVGSDEMYNTLPEEVILDKFKSEIKEVPDLDDKIREIFKKSDHKSQPYEPTN